MTKENKLFLLWIHLSLQHKISCEGKCFIPVRFALTIYDSLGGHNPSCSWTTNSCKGQGDDTQIRQYQRRNKIKSFSDTIKQAIYS